MLKVSRIVLVLLLSVCSGSILGQNAFAFQNTEVDAKFARDTFRDALTIGCFKNLYGSVKLSDTLPVMGFEKNDLSDLSAEQGDVAESFRKTWASGAVIAHSIGDDQPRCTVHAFGMSPKYVASVIDQYFTNEKAPDPIRFVRSDRSVKDELVTTVWTQPHGDLELVVSWPEFADPEASELAMTPPATVLGAMATMTLSNSKLSQNGKADTE